MILNKQITCYKLVILVKLKIHHVHNIDEKGSKHI